MYFQKIIARHFFIFHHLNSFILCFHAFAVEWWTGRIKTGACKFAVIDHLLELKMFGMAKHSPNGCYAVRSKKQEHVFHGLKVINGWNMCVHFRKARHQISSLAINHQRIFAKFRLFCITNKPNFSILHYYYLIFYDLLAVHRYYIYWFENYLPVCFNHLLAMAV